MNAVDRFRARRAAARSHRAIERAIAKHPSLRKELMIMATIHRD